jgi:tetratricopeptide (TPR) repeat protein
VLAATGVLAGIVAANTLYLLLIRAGVVVAGQGVTGSRVFQILLLGHTGLGVILVAVIVLFTGLHLPRVWARKNTRSLATGILTVAAGVVLLLTGLFVLTEAASRSHRWVWWVHVLVAGGSPLLYVLHRKASVVRSGPSTVSRLLKVTFSTLVVFVVAHVAVPGPGLKQQSAQFGDGQSYALERLGVAPPGYASPESPFYPSPATTASGMRADAVAILGPTPPSASMVEDAVRAEGFYTLTGIGAESCVRCHADVTEQWESSAHRFSSFNNPFYEAAVNLLRDSDRRSNWWLEVHRQADGSEASVGQIKSRWCGACHDPALLFAGDLDTAVLRESVAAQAGLTCLACHAIESIHDRTGNGNYRLRVDAGDPYLYSGIEDPGVKRLLHDAALRARPDGHRAAMLPPVMAQPEGCAGCHKVSLREPVNSYRWVRGQNEFDSWEDSGVSRENASTFYMPSERRVCRDCHMPYEPAPLGDLAAERGLVRSHRFVAANTALPFIRGDTAAVRRTEEFLRDEKLNVDVFAITDGEGRRVYGLDDGPVTARPGSVVTFDVVVRNRGVGHAFPGGTVDSNESWVEVHLVSSDGDTLAISGDLDEAGWRDPEAHVFGAMFVDSAGRVIDRRNPQDLRATVFTNVIGPGSADLSHYEVEIPATRGAYELRVRLMWRKFNRGYSVFTHATVPEAFPGELEAPQLPVTVIAEDRISLSVADGVEIRSSEDDDAHWTRYNDYGIASMREGRTTEATVAFEMVSRLAGDRHDGPLNLARTALAEGDVAAALQGLEEAENRAPGNASIAWVWGAAWQADGQYDQAAAAYRRALAEYPRHRASLIGLGRTLYLDGSFEDALGVLDQLLEIEPEHRAAWYHRMLSLRALGRAVQAAEAEAMVEYLQVDESSVRLTQELRLARPELNRMTQSVRTYRLKTRVGP